MNNKKAQEKHQTLTKILNILASSKIKVINLLKSIKKEASNNIMISLLSCYTFKYAQEKYKFQSDLYDNNFSSKNNINIVFLQEKITLSHTYERIIQSFIKNSNPKDKNYIVADFLVKDKRLEKCEIIKGEMINSLAYKIIIKYVSKNYKNVVIYSNIATNGINEIILPMNKMTINKNFEYQNLISGDINFYPSIQQVIESSFHDYTRCLMSYFYFNSKHSELKNTLLKYEGSIANVEDKINEITKIINKIRQNKITEEIILSSNWSENV